jgi:hypothetical protein
LSIVPCGFAPNVRRADARRTILLTVILSQITIANCAKFQDLFLPQDEQLRGNQDR